MTSPSSSPNDKLIIETIDISHSRLVDLAKLADQARPFYEWAERKFQTKLGIQRSFDEILQSASKEQITAGLLACYAANEEQSLPILFDGIGRSYPHQKACYYFFSWMVRDAPKQRLEPLIQRVMQVSGKGRVEVEILALTALIYRYRQNLKTFSWEAVREVVLDRLEGSRRSIRGHEKEIVVRTALITAIQDYYSRHSGYGIYAGVQIAPGQVKIGKESFDVSANLVDTTGLRIRRILMPVKTRETEGGGHSHLFTRDITAAIDAARFDNKDDFVIAVIVASCRGS